MPKKSPKKLEQESITQYAKLIEDAVLECATNGQADVWRAQNFHFGFFGLLSVDVINGLLAKHKKNRPLQRAILAGIISVAVQNLLSDA